MKTVSYISFLILAIALSGSSFSQQVVATAGGSASGASIELSWTIGEPVTATTYGSGFILTQGFHQGQPAIERFNHQINLAPGWNIISVNVIPDNNNLMNIFQSLIDGENLKKVMNETGFTVEDWGVYGGWINGIGALASPEGYKVNVNSATTISVDGTTFLFPFNILLKTGWNIISWPALNEQDGMDVFQSLIAAGKLKKVMDEEGKTIEDWGIYGAWINGIDNLKPGEGYKVNVTGDCVLTINASGTKSDENVMSALHATHFVPGYKGNGTDHMNINFVNLTESGIKEGDEIGIFDGNLCVGSAIISKGFIRSNQIGIPVSAHDGIEGINGFSNGNIITAKLYRNGTLLPLNIIPVKNQTNLFEKGSSLFAMANIDLHTQTGTFANNFKLNCYPNPFSEEVTVEINLAKEAEVSVEVINQTGQKVKYVSTKQMLNSGLHKIIWNGRNENNNTVSPGIYHLRVTVGESIIHRKIVYTASE